MRIIRCALESLQKERRGVIQIEQIEPTGRNYPKGILAHLYQHLPSSSLANIIIRDQQKLWIWKRDLPLEGHWWV